MTIIAYGEYSCIFNGEGITAVRDLFEIIAPSDAVVKISSVIWQQYNATPTDEMLKMAFRIYSGSYTSGSGGTTPTPQKITTGMAAAGSTCEANNTSQAAVGTGVIEHEVPLTINHRERLRSFAAILAAEPMILSPGQAFVWALNTAPAVSMTVNATVIIEEYGG